MRVSARHQLINLSQSALLLGGMALIVWIAAQAAVDGWLAALLAAMFLLGVFFTPAGARELTLSLYGAKRLDLNEYPFFRQTLAELSARAGLEQAPKLYIMPSAEPNAFAIGSRRDSAICVSRGLLRLLDKREFVGVAAHEISHIAHGDLWIMGVADALTRLTTLLSWLGQILLILNFPLLIIGAKTIGWWVPLALIFLPIAAGLLQLALSRTREFEADRGAAALTGDPAALASALNRLDQRYAGFWGGVFLPRRRSPEATLLRSHPPTQERIARLKALETQRPRASGALDIPSRVPTVSRAPGLIWLGSWR